MTAVNDIIQARIRARCAGEPVVTSFGFAVVADAGDFAQQAQALSMELDAVTALLGGSGGTWLEGLSVQYAPYQLDIVDVYPGTEATQSFALSGAGSVTDDDCLPPNDSMCITWRSLFKGPGGRGRNYLTGFAEGSQNGGYWEAGAQTYGETIIGNMLLMFGETGTGTHRLCIVHKTSNGGVRGAPVLPLVPPEIKPVMSATVHNEVRSIGRRAVGRRVHRTRVAP